MRISLRAIALGVIFGVAFWLVASQAHAGASETGGHWTPKPKPPCSTSASASAGTSASASTSPSASASLSPSVSPSVSVTTSPSATLPATPTSGPAPTPTQTLGGPFPPAITEISHAPVSPFVPGAMDGIGTGGSLAKTGDNTAVWFGSGVALILAGAVLGSFAWLRRRREFTA